MIRAGLRLSHCRHRVIAAGIDYRGRIITIRTNTPWMQSHGHHAEELIEAEIEKRLDHELWDGKAEEEEKAKNQLRQVANGYEDVAQFLEDTSA